MPRQGRLLYPTEQDGHSIDWLAWKRLSRPNSFGKRCMPANDADRRELAAVVCRTVVGDPTRGDRAATQPGESARGETADVEIRQETPGTSRPTAFEENLCRVSGYHLIERYCG
jgi:hypothetical protein